MVKSLVSKLSSSATSTVSIGTTFGGSNNSNNNNNNYNKNQSGNIISGSNITPINGVQQQQNKYRNDPGRFFGDGVQFKAKLIGILEVGEARGDRMCQEALQDLKMAIRAAGEHKQRITIHVTIDGLRLRDEKTGDSLYHHPVHKISFIAQDMTDTRAFGYIFGSPDSGHRFFGIKTDKAASQVVLAMRDLFQVVFELKKKEIELARQQIQSKSIINQDQQQQQQSQQQQQQQQQQHLSSLPSLKNAGGISSLTNDLSGGLGPGIGAGSLSLLGSNNLNIGTSDNTSNLSRDNKVTLKELSPESVADLVDLEQELNSLQRGITQMERITPSDTPQSLLSTAAQKSYYTTTISDDPFGDSFTVYNLLPPPEPGRSRHKSNNKLNEIGDHTSVISNTNIPISSSSGITTNSPISTGGLLLSPPNVVQLQYIPHNNLNSLQTQQPLQSHTLSTATTTLMDSDGNVCEDDDTWLRDLHSQNNVLDTTKLTLSELIGGSTIAPLAVDEVSSSLTPTQQLYGNNVNSIGSASEDRIVKQMVNGSGLTNTTDRNSLKNSSSLTDLFQTTFSTMVKDNLNITNVKSDLDPLGTGRTRPYVDKKYFFQDLKNPPKKVLKDLSITSSGPLGQYMEGSSSSMPSSATITITALTLKKEEKFSLNDSEIQSSIYATTVPINATKTTTITTTITNTFLTSGILSTTASGTQINTIKGTSATRCSIGTQNSVSSVTTATTPYAYANVNTKPTIINNNTSTFICTCPQSNTNASVSLTNTSVNRFTNAILGNMLTQGAQNSQSSQSLPKYPLSSFSTNTTAHTIITTISTFTMPFTQNNAMRFTRYPLEDANTNSNSTCGSGPDVTTATTATVSNPVMFPRDTDPFSPTRKKSDPFEEGSNVFSKLDPFEFEFIVSSDQISKSSTGGDSRPSNLTSSPANTARETTTKTQDDAFSGHLQVQLPEENTGDSGNASHINSSIRSRPMGSVIVPLPSAAAASSVFRQQTVDVLSSISNKKMPHLFGQSSRFSKRDSNSINMRRLQESDSLSENEAAPEPPPRPDISVYTEPPPLPPKKQSNDIVVRPRNGLPQQLLSNGGVGITNRYELSNSNFVSNNVLTSSRNMVSGISADSPPIPLPCRRVGRSDATYPGPGRPRKPCHTEDDYLAPLGTYTDTRIGTAEIPPLLPPPTQISTRARNQRQQNVGKTHELYENKNEIMQQQKYNQQQQPQQHEKVVADITLSQLLTLSIEELAIKLNVSTSKLSTMTLVELTTYLSEFIENSKSKLETENIKTGLEVALPVGQQSSVNKNSSNTFKINFDREATFVAKFDDTFGENLTSIQNNNTSFEANFAQFDKICSKGSQVMVGHQMPAVPPADRYAIFREIIDQELQNQETNLMGESEEEGDHTNTSNAGKFEAQFNDEELSPRPDHLNLNGVSTDITITTSTKIDTKITEVVAQAKDRYAALRDIILVENLFEKPCLQKKDNALEQEEQQNLTHYNGAINEVYDDDFNNEDQDLQQLMNEGTMLAPDSHQQRMGLVDSRGMLMEPSSSALTIEDEDDDDEDEEERDIDANVSTEADHACKTCSMGDDIINGGVSSGESNEKNKRTLTPGKYEQLANSIHQLEQLEGGKFEKLENTPTISITEEQNITLNESSLLTAVNINNLSKSKDDLEIDALMQRAISNLSIESRERNSPAISTTQSLPADISMDNAAKFKASPCTITTQYFHDVSTSPISLSQSPLPIVSKSPISTLTLINKVSQHQSTSPSIPTQLAVVSQLIDVATKKIRDDDATKSTPDSWATFDTMQHYHPKGPIEKRLRPLVKTTGKPSNFLHLPPPPAPASITSQNDTAGESPCSSDPREEAWNRRSGSNVSLGHQIPVLPSSRRWHKKESRHTSSSSRDLSWDDEQVGSQNKRLGNMMSGPVSLTIDRHSYHPRYSRRLNSCDEDYGYEEEFQATRRDQRQMKSKISRSRDNFDLDSPSYYHYGGAVHHTWSSQDFEQARAKAMERAVYERNISHAPAANYDKRGILFPSLPQTSKSSAYDRRTNRGKFYRSEYTRTSNSDFDEFGDSLSTYRDERIGSFEKLKMSRKPDYENVFDETRRTPPSLAMGVGIGGGSFKGARPTDLYAYERDRKSFDRESLESFESLTAPRRRRRSFGSTAVGGPDMTIDPYTTYDNREEYHRYVASEKSRSLRKLTKCSRTSGGGGDIDYERDSDEDHRPPRTHLSGSTCAPFGSGPNGSGVMVTYYYRKKQRLRNKNAQGSSGGRYRDTLTGVMRPNTFDYVTCGNNQTNDEDDDAEDYVDEEEDEEEAMQGDDDDMPTDEDKFERLNRRRHEMHQRIMESEQRRYHDGGSVISSKLNTPSISGGNISSASFGSYNRRSNKGSYASNRLQQTPLTPPDRCNQDYGYDDDDYEQTPTPQSNTSSALPNVVTPNTSTKFHFDVGFESDFNQSSPPPVPISATTFSSGNSTPAVSSIATIPKQSYRFSNDFSDKEKTKYQTAQQQKFDRDRDNRSRKPLPNNINSTIAGGGGGVQKLRFDDNVKVSQFDDESTTVVAFEDDFSKATFDTFEYVDQWHHEGDNLIQKMPSLGNRKQQIRNSILQQRQQELLKKSESINIFAKKSEDPFEDDDFFKSPASSVAATTTETTLVLTMAPTILLPSSAADVNISSTTTTITTTGSINNSDGGGGNNNGDSGSGSGNGGRSDIGDYAPHSDASHGNLTVNNGSHNFSNIVQQQSQQQHDQSQSTPTTMPASHQWDDSNSNFAKFDENM